MINTRETVSWERKHTRGGGGGTWTGDIREDGGKGRGVEVIRFFLLFFFKAETQKLTIVKGTKSVPS